MSITQKQCISHRVQIPLRKVRKGISSLLGVFYVLVWLVIFLLFIIIIRIVETNGGKEYICLKIRQETYCTH